MIMNNHKVFIHYFKKDGIKFVRKTKKKNIQFLIEYATNLVIFVFINQKKKFISSLSFSQVFNFTMMHLPIKTVKDKKWLAYSVQFDRMFEREVSLYQDSA